MDVQKVPTSLKVNNYIDLSDKCIRKGNDVYQICELLSGDGFNFLFYLKKNNEDKPYVLKVSRFGLYEMFKEETFFVFNHDKIPKHVNIIRFENSGLNITIGKHLQCNIITEKKKHCLSNVDLYLYFSQKSKLDFNSFCINMIRNIECINDLNFIHGDIKPSNIVFDDIKEPFLIDFGSCSQIIEKLENEKKGEPRLVSNREITRTLVYMSLDSMVGLTGRRSDLESFGYILYEILEDYALPWIYDINMKNVFEMKQSFLEDISQDENPNKILKQYFNILYDTDYNQKPDYKKLYKIFEDNE